MYSIDRRSTSRSECAGGACTFEPGGCVMSGPPAPFACRSDGRQTGEARLRRRAVHVDPPVPEHVVALADALVARVDKIQGPAQHARLTDARAGEREPGRPDDRACADPVDAALGP